MDAKEYLCRAHYYLALANEMTSDPNRVAMLELAGFWMRLAEHAELNERVVKQLHEMWQWPPTSVDHQLNQSNASKISRSGLRNQRS
jgi:hypothetical protein